MDRKDKYPSITYIIIIVISLSVVILGSCFLHTTTNAGLKNYMNILGSNASIIGIILVLWEVSKLKTQSEATSLAISKTQAEFLNRTIISLLIKTIEQFTVLESLLRDNEFNECLTTLRRFKSDVAFIVTRYNSKSQFKEERDLVTVCQDQISHLIDDFIGYTDSPESCSNIVPIRKQFESVKDSYNNLLNFIQSKGVDHE